MKKFLNTLTIAATVTVSMLASAAIPATVRKHGSSTNSLSTVPAVSSRKSVSAKGFYPSTVKTQKGMKSDSNLHKVRSRARISPVIKGEEANASIPQLNGVMIYNSSWGAYTKPGLYSLPSSTSDEFQMIVPEAYGSGVVKDDRLFMVSHIYFPDLELNYPRLTVYDMETKKEIFFENYSSNPDWSILPVDMDIDPVSGDVYGITYNSTFTGYQLSKLTFTDKSVSSECVAPLDPTYNWNSMAFDASGKIYAISKENAIVDDMIVCVNSTLNTIDKTTGAITEIGDTGLAPEYSTSATIDHTTGRMFWTVSPLENVSYLAEVNLSTGAATILQTYENAEEITSLYAVVAEAEPTAPAKVTNLEALFENGALTGKISFKAPTTLYNGTAATGELKYEILANDTKVAEGTTSFGEDVSENITLTDEGNYKFTIKVSNQTGESPAASVSVVVGNGVPYATPYISLKYADGKMNLTWMPVNETVDGGYIDPLKVTYTVVRYPGEVVVADKTVDTSFSESIPVPPSFISYYYTVTTNFENKSSAPASSNHVGLGAIVPPYNETFDAEESLAGWTIIDVNQDMRRWMWSTWNNLRISFNASSEMDDWAITPGIQLEAGSAYQLSFDVYGDGGNDTETIEVKMGDANNVEGMTTVVVAPTDVNGNYTKENPLTVRATITPTTSGVYYIGFHGISAADQYMLNLDNVKIESALNAGAPAAPSNFTVTPDASGELKATLSFTTPDKSIAGGAIWQNLTKVEILRDGEVIKILTSVAPNSKESYEDTLSKAGTYNYAVRCYNMFGEGLSAYASTFVGVNIPAAPTNVAIGETVNEGEVTVSWSAVTTDIDGRSIPASKVKYMIAAPTSTGWTAIYDDLTGTSHTFMAASSYQDMVQYAVFAKTEGGTGEGTLSPMIPVGPAYSSLHESFANGTVSNLWGTQVIANAQFGIFNDESGYTSQDSDNGFLGMVGEKLDDSAAFFSGKINLADMQNPTLSFYTFNLAPNNANTIEVGVKVAGTENYTTVKMFKISDICNPGEWGKVVIPLDAFKGKTIQFQLTGVVKIYPYIFIDNINVDNTASFDLAITSISAPETVETGSDYNVTVTVSNEGTKAASGFTVDLFADGVKVDTANGKAIEPGESVNVTFARHADALSTKEVEYSASVIYADDENLLNNESEEIYVESVKSTLPVPENLTISSSANGIELAWSEPDLSKLEPVMTTNDIEDAESFASEMKDWIFVDQDKSPVGGIDGASGGSLNIPNIIGGVSTASFFIFDASLPQFGSALEAFSGNKYLAAMYRADNGVTDDWAISPELTGEAQKVSFVAKSLSSSSEEAEHVQVLYSTGSVNPDDFVAVGDFRTVPSKWTKMTFNLPAGAKRFAIRSSSEASFMLMIDDITFTPAVNLDDYKISGYNVYRESVRLNNTPVSATVYNDATGEADHRYVVTAIYEKKGESGASNSTSLSVVESVVISFNVAVKDGSIIVTGAEEADVTVSALNGMTIHSGRGDARINVTNGVYLVKVGKTVVKVIVK